MKNLKHWLIRLRHRLFTQEHMLGSIFSELWETGKKPILLAALAGLGLLILIPIITYIIFAADMQSKSDIINKKSEGLVLTDRNDKPFFTFYQARTKSSVVTLDQIPKDTQHAVIAIEDKDFYQHGGFSIRSIGRAILADLQQDKLAQGGSTISQQLIKNALLSDSKSFLRKYQELVLAIELERRYSKNDILEMYLNTVYFGEGAFGIEDGAKAYFGKDASDLDLAESALLAGLLQAPSAYSPLSGDRNAAFQREKLVLQDMYDQGYITAEQRDAAEAEEITFHPVQTVSDLNTTAPHFALMVKQELIDKYGEQKVAQSGFHVRTTLDLSKQEYAEAVVKNQVAALASSNVSNGATVVMDPKTDEILALVGSHDWSDPDNGKVNMATHPRSPGSSFKPIVYSKAFEERVLTPGSILDDKEYVFPGGYKPKNYDDKFHGKVTVRRALANSFNIPAVLALQKIGIDSAMEMGKRLGITTFQDPSHYGLSFVLGSAEVPLTEMAEVYSVFADSGNKHTITDILQVSDKHGNVIYTSQPTTEQVMDPSIAFLISSILSDNAARAEEFGNVLTISRPAAVKTGTSEDYRDSLTIGYTPSLVVAVWVGNNDNAPMDKIAGSIGAAPIWRSLMEHYLAFTPIEHFTEPPGVTSEMICKDNGLKAEVATSSAYMEYFLDGTEPTQLCNLPTQGPSESPTPSVSPTPTPTNEPSATPTQSPTPTTSPLLLSPSPTPIQINIP